MLPVPSGIRWDQRSNPKHYRGIQWDPKSTVELHHEIRLDHGSNTAVSKEILWDHRSDFGIHGHVYPKMSMTTRQRYQLSLTVTNAVPLSYQLQRWPAAGWSRWWRRRRPSGRARLPYCRVEATGSSAPPYGTSSEVNSPDLCSCLLHLRHTVRHVESASICLRWPGVTYRDEYLHGDTSCSSGVSQLRIYVLSVGTEHTFLFTWFMCSCFFTRSVRHVCDGHELKIISSVGLLELRLCADSARP